MCYDLHNSIVVTNTNRNGGGTLGRRLFASLVLALGLVGLFAGRALAYEYWGVAELVYANEVYPNDWRCFFGQSWLRKPSLASGYKLDYNARTWAKQGNSSYPTTYARPAGYLRVASVLAKDGNVCTSWGWQSNSTSTYMLSMGAPTTGCGAGSYRSTGNHEIIYNGSVRFKSSVSPTVSVS